MVLFDKARFPRDKCCGDGLTTGALRRLERLGLRPGVGARPGSRSTTSGSGRRRAGRSASRCPPTGGSFGAVARRVDLDAALLDVARAAGVKVLDGHGVTGAALGPAGDAVRLDVDGVGPVWRPLRHRRRRHVVDRCARRSGRPTSPATWASGTPSASTSPTSGPRAAAAVGVVRARPAARATPGRSRCPAAGPTSASASTGPPAGRRSEMKRPVAGAAGPAPHPRRARADGAEPEAPHKAWPIPARVGHTPLTAAGGGCSSSATRPGRPTR